MYDHTNIASYPNTLVYTLTTLKHWMLMNINNKFENI